MPILYYSNDYEKEGDLLVLLDINRRGDKCFVYYPEGDIAIAYEYNTDNYMKSKFSAYYENGSIAAEWKPIEGEISCKHQSGTPLLVHILASSDSLAGNGTILSEDGAIIDRWTSTSPLPEPRQIILSDNLAFRFDPAQPDVVDSASSMEAGRFSFFFKSSDGQRVMIQFGQSVSIGSISKLPLKCTWPWDKIGGKSPLKNFQDDNSKIQKGSNINKFSELTPRSVRSIRDERQVNLFQASKELNLNSPSMTMINNIDNRSGVRFEPVSSRYNDIDNNHFHREAPKKPSSKRRNVEDTHKVIISTEGFDESGEKTSIIVENKIMNNRNFNKSSKRNTENQSFPSPSKRNSSPYLSLIRQVDSETRRKDEELGIFDSYSYRAGAYSTANDDCASLASTEPLKQNFAASSSSHMGSSANYFRDGETLSPASSHRAKSPDERGHERRKTRKKKSSRRRVNRVHSNVSVMTHEDGTQQLSVSVRSQSPRRRRSSSPKNQKKRSVPKSVSSAVAILSPPPTSPAGSSHALLSKLRLNKPISSNHSPPPTSSSRLPPSLPRVDTSRTFSGLPTSPVRTKTVSKNSSPAEHSTAHFTAMLNSLKSKQGNHASPSQGSHLHYSNLNKRKPYAPSSRPPQKADDVSPRLTSPTALMRAMSRKEKAQQDRELARLHRQHQKDILRRRQELKKIEEESLSVAAEKVAMSALLSDSQFASGNHRTSLSSAKLMSSASPALNIGTPSKSVNSTPHATFLPPSRHLQNVTPHVSSPANQWRQVSQESYFPASPRMNVNDFLAALDELLVPPTVSDPSYQLSLDSRERVGQIRRSSSSSHFPHGGVIENKNYLKSPASSSLVQLTHKVGKSIVSTSVTHVKSPVNNLKSTHPQQSDQNRSHITSNVSIKNSSAKREQRMLDGRAKDQESRSRSAERLPNMMRTATSESQDINRMSNSQLRTKIHSSSSPSRQKGSSLTFSVLADGLLNTSSSFSSTSSQLVKNKQRSSPSSTLMQPQKLENSASFQSLHRPQSGSQLQQMTPSSRMLPYSIEYEKLQLVQRLTEIEEMEKYKRSSSVRSLSNSHSNRSTSATAHANPRRGEFNNNNGASKGLSTNYLNSNTLRSLNSLSPPAPSSSSILRHSKDIATRRDKTNRQVSLNQDRQRALTIHKTASNSQKNLKHNNESPPSSPLERLLGHSRLQLMSPPPPLPPPPPPPPQKVRIEVITVSPPRRQSLNKSRRSPSQSKSSFATSTHQNQKRADTINNSRSKSASRNSNNQKSIKKQVITHNHLKHEWNSDTNVQEKKVNENLNDDLANGIAHKEPQIVHRPTLDFSKASSSSMQPKSSKLHSRKDGKETYLQEHQQLNSKQDDRQQNVADLASGNAHFVSLRPASSIQGKNNDNDGINFVNNKSNPIVSTTQHLNENQGSTSLMSTNHSATVKRNIENKNIVSTASAATTSNNDSAAITKHIIEKPHSSQVLLNSINQESNNLTLSNETFQQIDDPVLSLKESSKSQAVETNIRPVSNLPRWPTASVSSSVSSSKTMSRASTARGMKATATKIDEHEVTPPNNSSFSLEKRPADQLKGEISGGALKEAIDVALQSATELRVGSEIQDQVRKSLQHQNFEKHRTEVVKLDVSQEKTTKNMRSSSILSRESNRESFLQASMKIIHHPNANSIAAEENDIKVRNNLNSDGKSIILSSQKIDHSPTKRAVFDRITQDLGNEKNYLFNTQNSLNTSTRNNLLSSQLKPMESPSIFPRSPPSRTVIDEIGPSRPPRQEEHTHLPSNCIPFNNESLIEHTAPSTLPLASNRLSSPLSPPKPHLLSPSRMAPSQIPSIASERLFDDSSAVSSLRRVSIAVSRASALPAAPGIEPVSPPLIQKKNLPSQLGLPMLPAGSPHQNMSFVPLTPTNNGIIDSSIRHESHLYGQQHDYGAVKSEPSFSAPIFSSYSPVSVQNKIISDSDNSSYNHQNNNLSNYSPIPMVPVTPPRPLPAHPTTFHPSGSAAMRMPHWSISSPIRPPRAGRKPEDAPPLNPGGKSNLSVPHILPARLFSSESASTSILGEKNQNTHLVSNETIDGISSEIDHYTRATAKNQMTSGTRIHPPSMKPMETYYAFQG